MIIYLDTETTGLYPGQICQLSYIMQNENQVTAKNFFFKVKYVEEGAYLVHGFSVEKLNILSNGKVFADHIDEIEKDFLSSKLLVTHNASFDMMFLRKEFERANKEFNFESYCTMKNSTCFCKLPKSRGYGYKYPKLTELLQKLNISDNTVSIAMQKCYKENANFHDARFDTCALFLSVNKGFSYGLFNQLKEELYNNR